MAYKLNLNKAAKNGENILADTKQKRIQSGQ